MSTSTRPAPRPAGSEERPETRRRRRTALWAGVLVVALALVAAFVVAGRDPAGPGAGDRPAGTGVWLSGASGDAAVSGEFTDWRGRPLEIAGQWSDTNEAMVELWDLAPGGDWADWDGPIDIAIGAIDDGETWEAAADGAYDERWRESLTRLQEFRGDKSGATYIRFAHESNSDWYPWSVDSTEAEDFRAAWNRFRALQQEIYPESLLVFNVNRESVETGIDWRETFPGANQVDVLGVDYYNQYPYAGTDEEFQESLDDVDEYGAPKGLEAHRQFAEDMGLPFAVSEWSGNADFGDSPAFVEGMYQWFSMHGGTGAGQVLYEILFNVEDDRYGNRFLIFGDDVRMPDSAEAYRRLW
ncbi:glycosyl hydrolase [Blastococcus sp. TF02A-26]|uniref:glycosyl hydrolase n=1 Tax=Blastococcus sp. TF02A-26 TaxID=2250577 RepID=UPI000DEB167C|nr:glycosyl hydrolase [Blastococcus sp. TF02A-26]RBY87379.1 hypothetical protein DQ240_07250 [Blastococcus sp. TF02A-26]